VSATRPCTPSVRCGGGADGGLHFDEALLEAIAAKGVERAFVTLHVGAGTFQPVRVDKIEDHHMHSEWLEVGQDVVDAVEACRARGGRVIAVGTTSVRSLESAARDGVLKPFSGDTDIFIYPGRPFHVVDALVTNFHLPESTLLMLVSAFAGYPETMAAYKAAVDNGYRFFSYGDAMFITRNPAPRPQIKHESHLSNVLRTAGHRRQGPSWSLTFPRGTVETPAFMPVGTYGTVKGMLPRDIEAIGAEIILGNTFHLWLRPGTEVIKKHGGLHDFMQWKGPILTDSGGFQVFSLGAMRKIKEEGVTFASPVDGSKVFMGPEESMQVQRDLGSDIVMIFDECTPYPADEDVARTSMELSLRWAQRSKNATATTPRRCSASFRAACTRTCACARWKAWTRSASMAWPSAVCRWASPSTR
jgi:hypothetical protein